MKDYDRIMKLKGEVNHIKDMLWNIADNLEEAGAIQKAKSLRTIVLNIEEWQRKR